jgi:hypothetical protein
LNGMSWVQVLRKKIMWGIKCIVFCF